MPQLKLKDYSLLSGNIWPIQIYLSYFEKIPSSIYYSGLNFKELIQKFPEEFKDEIIAHHYEINKLSKEEVGEHIFILRNEILIQIEFSYMRIFCYSESNSTKRIEDFGKKFKKEKPDVAQINLITMSNGDFQNRKIDFKRLSLKLDQLYNEDFEAFHKKMYSILKEENQSGLHLLYGIPGTGKSTYIRYLCGKLKKEIIFLPGQLAQNLDNVYMTRYLIANSNSILVIEDAEELIVSRDHQRNSNLAMILNITDGILGESLGIQIIATFNTDLRNIDPALKRKGRLKSSYEFKALEPEKANRLLEKEGIEEQTSSPLTLADIYNFKEEQQMKQSSRKAVGFK
ncbi:hypothetical protein C7S20_18290 [Christiangramia fulva]|uniref:ATPase AAA-type core domain-containing protein n=1 Tax=Christiangramia fulva TaxID=2126553 RepID=A0A2R3Z9S0_9FLAO|nr:AAA family ATPase [Christiangramia fulva]AVR47038.1 hypothetical protein C7S20_18290 [Christiangramia fulva]